MSQRLFFLHSSDKVYEVECERISAVERQDAMWLPRIQVPCKDIACRIDTDNYPDYLDVNGQRHSFVQRRGIREWCSHAFGITHLTEPEFYARILAPASLFEKVGAKMLPPVYHSHCLYERLEDAIERIYTRSVLFKDDIDFTWQRMALYPAYKKAMKELLIERGAIPLGER